MHACLSAFAFVIRTRCPSCLNGTARLSLLRVSPPIQVKGDANARMLIPSSRESRNHIESGARFEGGLSWTYDADTQGRLRASRGLERPVKGGETKDLCRSLGRSTLCGESC
ncbi:hypothetical protein IE81DRAFT_158945 [Ceraceosorus guamensis]|uniref:Uncharacterized protein n=1 Tax=Ceraceosorus guamensis TaxID=1522189 RepID=A0A316W262_9BASI|nr:hypothetical protein IE81DRAFT_158945 [Ceraceosorus guamensis]PWN41765.1 hypothetical protein IE81DRAFT_158945 [Ceraceosorus guamensis]